MHFDDDDERCGFNGPRLALDDELDGAWVVALTARQAHERRKVEASAVGNGAVEAEQARWAAELSELQERFFAVWDARREEIHESGPWCESPQDPDSIERARRESKRERDAPAPQTTAERAIDLVRHGIAVAYRAQTFRSALEVGILEDVSWELGRALADEATREAISAAELHETALTQWAGETSCGSAFGEAEAFVRDTRHALLFSAAEAARGRGAEEMWWAGVNAVTDPPEEREPMDSETLARLLEGLPVAAVGYRVEPTDRDLRQLDGLLQRLQGRVHHDAGASGKPDVDFIPQPLHRLVMQFVDKMNAAVPPRKPTQKKIAEDTGIRLTDVGNAARALEGAGWLARPDGERKGFQVTTEGARNATKWRATRKM